MNPLRRGALVRAGKLLAGGVAAAATLGNTGRGQSLGAGAQVDAGKVPDWGPVTSAYINAKQDPSSAARDAACKPLYAKINEIESERRWSIGADVYLEGLQSVAPWWKASVALDRHRRRETAIQKLYNRIDELRRSPLDKIEELANEALGAFMAEIQKP